MLHYQWGVIVLRFDIIFVMFCCRAFFRFGLLFCVQWIVFLPFLKLINPLGQRSFHRFFKVFIFEMQSSQWKRACKFSCSHFSFEISYFLKSDWSIYLNSVLYTKLKYGTIWEFICVLTFKNFSFLAFEMARLLSAIVPDRSDDSISIRSISLSKR